MFRRRDSVSGSVHALSANAGLPAQWSRRRMSSQVAKITAVIDERMAITEVRPVGKNKRTRFTSLVLGFSMRTTPACFRHQRQVTATRRRGKKTQQRIYYAWILFIFEFRYRYSTLKSP